VRGWPHRHPPNTQFTLNRQSPLSLGLVGWWSGQGSRGANIVHDYADNRADGTFNGSPTWVANGEIGAGVSFPTSTASYIAVGSPSHLDNLPAVGMTIALWWLGVDASGGDHKIAISKSDASGDGWMLGVASSNILWLKTVDSGGAARDTFVTHVTSGLQLIVATVAPSTPHRIYRNGLEVSYNTQATTGATYGSDAANNVDIGRLGNAGFWPFNSVIYDAKIWNRVLSPVEVSRLYQPQNRWELHAPVQRIWAIGKAPAVGGGSTTRRYSLSLTGVG
jgi:hypothetical protein